MAATVGYDLTTGLGIPRADNFVHDLAAGAALGWAEPRPDAAGPILPFGGRTPTATVRALLNLK